ncbi:hypothetical protein ACJ73_06384, partial [Blastomyces percursus]
KEFGMPDLPGAHNTSSIRKSQPTARLQDSKSQEHEHGGGNQGKKASTPVLIQDRPYCSQECLLGLRDRRTLDQSCPNFPDHHQKPSLVISWQMSADSSLLTGVTMPIAVHSTRKAATAPLRMNTKYMMSYATFKADMFLYALVLSSSSQGSLTTMMEEDTLTCSCLAGRGYPLQNAQASGVHKYPTWSNSRSRQVIGEEFFMGMLNRGISMERFHSTSDDSRFWTGFDERSIGCHINKHKEKKASGRES